MYSVRFNYKYVLHKIALDKLSDESLDCKYHFNNKEIFIRQ